LLQQGFPLPEPLYFIATFSASVIYYTIAYVTDGTMTTNNLRTLWYQENKVLVSRSQWIMYAVLAVSAGLLLKEHLKLLFQISIPQWILILIFPAAAILYYGLNSWPGKYNLRSIGWLKPFVIGFIWAGLVTVYPVLFHDIIEPSNYSLNPIGAFLFIKNFMFISVLCIMFDIKDYAMDSNAQLKTFVVNVGLRRTIFQIIIPLSLIGVTSFLCFGIMRGFQLMKLALNVIPFILLIIVAYSLHNRRSVLYYLIIIDGLMLVKAICGTLAMIYF
jgi:hypothetical protein